MRGSRKEKIVIETTEDKWRASIHECGHLSASFVIPCLETIESVSIFSPYQPGWLDGSEMRLPQITCYETAKGTLIMLLAGRAAEEFFFNEISSLSESDMAISTALAYKMFSAWGMSKNLGLVNNRLVQELVILKSIQNLVSLSNEIQEEIKKLLEEAYSLALEHVEINASTIVEWASELYEKEYFGYKDIKTISAKVKFQSSIKSNRLKDQENTLNMVLQEKIDNLEVDNSSDEHSKKMVSILKKNKNIIEMQVATLGINAPAHLITQLEDINAQLSRLQDA